MMKWELKYSWSLNNETVRGMDPLYSQKSKYNLKSQPPASEVPLQLQVQPTADRVVLCVLSRFSRVQLFATLWTAAYQVPLSMGVLQARIPEWVAFMSPALIGRFFSTSTTWEAHSSDPVNTLEMSNEQLPEELLNSLKHCPRKWHSEFLFCVD